MSRFAKEQVSKAYEAYIALGKNPKSLDQVLTVDIIIYYQNLAKDFAKEDEYTLKYISKN